MRSAKFEGLGPLHVAATFAEAGEFEPARQIAHARFSAANVRSQA